MKDIIEEDLDNIISDKNIPWQHFSGKNVLITGANGFLPAYMLKTLLFLNKSDLLEQPVHVFGMVRNLAKARVKLNDCLDDTNFELIEQDVSKLINFAPKIDFIVHAASQASPKYFFSDPVGTIKANTIGTSQLLDLAVLNKVEGFLYFSSGEVNGNAFDYKDCVKEEDYGLIDPLNIRNCYAVSKKMGENMCASYFAQYGVPTKIVRPSHTYGPGFDLNDGRFFSTCVNAILQHEDIVLNSDGSAKRCFLYLADAVRGYFTVLLKGENGKAYNVSNDYETSILELAQIVASFSEDTNVVLNIDKNSPSSKASHGLLDNTKLKSLGWYSTIKEKEGFLRTIQSFKD